MTDETKESQILDGDGWVYLTREEIYEIGTGIILTDDGLIQFARDIEAKAKEKNSVN